MDSGVPTQMAQGPQGPQGPQASEGSMMGGSLMVKKTDEKVKVMGRERCVYIDCKRHKLVKVKGSYMRLADARAATKPSKK